MRPNTSHSTRASSGSQLPGGKPRRGSSQLLFVIGLLGMVTLSPSLCLAETPRTGNLEFKVGSYEPDIDSEFSGSEPGPYETVFGEAIFPLYLVRGDYLFYQGIGSLGVGAGAGWGQASGHGKLADGTTSSDTTTFNMMPFDVGIIYEFDWLAQRWPVPFVPYGRADLTYTIWWFKNGIDEVTDYTDPVTDKTSDGYGGTWGTRFTGGMRVLLDTFAPGMAHTFDVDFGVNNTYLFLEVVYSIVDDFGSDSSIHLGSTSYNGGIAFEF